MRTLIALFLCNFFYTSYTQSIIIDPTSIDIHIANADLSDDFLTFSPTVGLTNTTSDTLNIIWRRELLTDCPATWDLLVSDIYNDFIPSINSNYDPSINLNATFPILPNQTIDNAIYSHLLPRSTAGCCEVAIHISELNNPDNVIATAYFDYLINNPDCTLVNISDTKQAFINVFPNPVNKELFISTPFEVRSAELFDLNGRKLKIFKNPPYLVEELSTGIYLLNIETEDGRKGYFKINKI